MDTDLVLDLFRRTTEEEDAAAASKKSDKKSERTVEWRRDKTRTRWFRRMNNEQAVV